MKKAITFLCFIISNVGVQAQNVGIGAASPQSKLSVGPNSEFQVDSLGNITKVNNVSYSFPQVQGAKNTALQNRGAGSLNWQSGVVPTGAIISSVTFDSAIINLGYSFIGGYQQTFRAVVDSQAWQWGNTLSSIGAPAARSDHSAVWTGTEMIIWGGDDIVTGLVNTGARYNPVTDSWGTTTSTGSAPTARRLHSAIWTGTEMIIWGGAVSGNNALNTGGRYNPSTNTWGTAISTSGAPAPRWGHSAVFTGTEMIVWGGFGNSTFYNNGSRYTVSGNTWSSAVSTSGAPSARRQHTAVWTGSNMIVWGGDSLASFASMSSGRYEPASNSWLTPITGTGAPAPRSGHTAVWTGTYMIIWGGSQSFVSGSALDDGALYHLQSNTWVGIPATSKSPEGRSGHSAVWTGTDMLIWGGFKPNAPYYLADGKRFGNYYYPAFATGAGMHFYLFRKN